jgi:Zn-dependent protease
MLGWVFSVCLHEYGHALVAYYGGDTSVEEKGYLSLNPLRYGHPVMSLVLPLVYLMMGGFGLPGGAVYIEESRIRSKGWLAAVSLAGPAMNILLALVLWVPLRFNLFPTPGGVVACASAFLFFLQITAVLFNLLPVPPLDGFSFVRHWLPRPVRNWMTENASILFVMLIMVFMMNSLISNSFTYLCLWICYRARVPMDLVVTGMQTFRFWNY